MYVCDVRDDCCCSDKKNIQALNSTEVFTPPQVSLDHKGNYWEFRESFYFSEKSSEANITKSSLKELKSMAKFLDKSKDRIQITGLFLPGEYHQHELGHARAENIKNILVKLGAPASSIDVASRENKAPIIARNSRNIYNAIEFDFVSPSFKDFSVLEKGINVHFESASGELNENESMREFLYGACEYLESHPNTIISCIGHTDNQGNESSNQKLSEKRAKEVAQYLMEFGINKKQIEFIGFGEIAPIATNSSELGREQNRRVEVKLIKTNKK